MLTDTVQLTHPNYPEEDPMELRVTLSALPSEEADAHPLPRGRGSMEDPVRLGSFPPWRLGTLSHACGWTGLGCRPG